MEAFAFVKCCADNAVLIMLLCLLCVSGFQPIRICKLQDLVVSVKLDCCYLCGAMVQGAHKKEGNYLVCLRFGR